MAYDTTGYQVGRTYDFTSSCRGCWYFNNGPNGFGEAAWTSDNNSSPTYQYDPAGRLSYSYDQVNTGATMHLFTRRYSYDADSNRLSANVESTSYAALVTADAPSADWHLDETSGTTAADAVGSTPGTYSGSGNTLGTVGATPAPLTEAPPSGAPVRSQPPKPRRSP